MDLVALVGRILFVLIFFGSAYGHFTNTDYMAGYAQAKKLPAPRLAVLGSGVWMVVGGLLVLLGLWGDFGALMLFLFLAPTALVMHAFWRETDPRARANEQIQFMKDIALAGGALLIFVLYRTDKVGLAITGPLFGSF
ncbi:hypothetical protein GCM10012275_15480 [Longimycelium tulufanense]|uniref:DoxX family protein n=1 Tax=Longimycelium tulufanense TaxID=907463 RepID=A0A8J3CCB4_9PSEU|nr:DoxX family membrane protein [Longimycelium tulufanense]GGM45355.1 hypothetical protein GCM10012275_15480 [Longimycelium tulufanense]